MAFARRLLRRQKKKARKAARKTSTTTPTTIPAIAPLERPLLLEDEEDVSGGDEGGLIDCVLELVETVYDEPVVVLETLTGVAVGASESVLGEVTLLVATVLVFVEPTADAGTAG